MKHLPYAELMVNPEKLMKVLRSGRTESRAATVAEPAESQAKRSTRTSTNITRKPAGSGPGKPGGPASGDPSPEAPKKIEFRLKSPAAKSVKLAGDFTDWEKHAVNMIHSSDEWFAVVPLSPGSYSYRFIVDGKWADDPRSHEHIPNDFGSQNAVIRVS